jgi:hypothetical protein
MHVNKHTKGSHTVTAVPVTCAATKHQGALCQPFAADVAVPFSVGRWETFEKVAQRASEGHRAPAVGYESHASYDCMY